MFAKTLIPALFLSALCMFAVGCSQTPVPVSRPYSTQDKLQASQHWQVIAQDLSWEISEMLKMADQANLQNRHIQILNRDASPFSQALESFLVTDMTHLGLQVNRQDAEDYQLYWSVQSVTHKEKRDFTSPPFGSFTALSALGYGVYKVYDDSTDFAATVATGLAADLAKELYYLNQLDLPHNEIIVNITIQSGNNIVYRLSNIYYINDLDTDHYHFAKDLYHADKEVKTRTYQVTSTDAEEALAKIEETPRVFFKFDKHDIQDEYKDLLEEYVQVLKQNPDMELLIEGHADIIGSEEYNLDLSLQRAMAVHDYLVQHSVSSSRLQTKGYGYSKPIAPNFTDDQQDNPEGRAKNRRVELSPLQGQVAAK